MSQIHTDPDMAVELFVLEPISTEIVAELEVDLSQGSETSSDAN
jgi:hypothetical protein